LRLEVVSEERVFDDAAERGEAEEEGLVERSRRQPLRLVTTEGAIRKTTPTRPSSV
jgi:hypothetical protein